MVPSAAVQEVPKLESLNRSITVSKTGLGVVNNGREYSLGWTPPSSTTYTVNFQLESGKPINHNSTIAENADRELTAIVRQLPIVKGVVQSTLNSYYSPFESRVFSFAISSRTCSREIKKINEQITAFNSKLQELKTIGIYSIDPLETIEDSWVSDSAAKQPFLTLSPVTLDGNSVGEMLRRIDNLGPTVDLTYSIITGKPATSLSSAVSTQNNKKDMVLAALLFVIALVVARVLGSQQSK